MDAELWMPSPWRQGLFYEVWRREWADAFGSAYKCAKTSYGRRLKFWTLKGAQAHADRLNATTPGASHEK